MATVTAQLKALDEQMTKLAIAEVERLARKILADGLKGRNPARSFCMCMGSAFFVDRHGEPLCHEITFPQPRRWYDPFYNFLEAWDDQLKLTGWPMKINSPDGPVITDW